MLNRRAFLLKLPASLILPAGVGAMAAERGLKSSPSRASIPCAEFGLVGEADETAQFENLRRFLLREPGHTIIFERGVTYNSRTPKWLAEVQDVTILAHGAFFRNLDAHRYGYADMVGAVVIGSGSFFHDDQGTGQIDQAKANNGWLIRDLAPGDQSVLFSMPRESANFSVGDRVLLDWFCRQASSFPPNPGYWLYSTVVEVNPGMVRLADKAPVPFHATAPESTTYGATTGRARIRNLDRPGYKIAGRIRWHGGGSVRNGAVKPGVAAYDGMFIICGAIDVEATDLEGFTGHVPTMVRRYKFLRASFDDPGSANEIDKIIDVAEYEDCSIFELAQATGLKQLSVSGGRMTGRSQPIRSRRFSARNVSVLQQGIEPGGAMLFHDTYPADVIDVDYCRFFPDRSQGAAVQPGNAPAFKPDHVSEHKMVIELGNPEYETIIRSIDFGSKITLLEGRRFESFTVTDLNFDKLGHLLILGTHNVSIPSGAERRRLWCTKKYVSSGRNIFVDAPLTFRELRHGNRVYENRLGRPARNDGKLSFIMRAGEYYVADVNMVVNRITVEVVTPYSGNDRIAALSVANQGLGPALPTINVNAKEKGVRGVDRTNIHGLRPGDVLSTKLAKDSYCEGLVLHLHGDGGTASFDDGPRTRLPLIVVEVDGMTL